MRWPWRPPAALRRAVTDTARFAADLAGLPRPVPAREPMRHRDLEALVARTAAALSALRERLGNQERTIAALRATPAAAPAPAAGARKAALAIADLADQVRRLGPEAAPGWIPERLAVALRELGAAEFTDAGAADPARHEIVGRRPAGPGRPAGHIAGTVRPGVLLGGKVLRAQQVIVNADIARDAHE